MASALLEGAAAAWQPCSLPLLIGALATVAAAGRTAALVIGAYVVAASIAGWARFTTLWPVDFVGVTQILGGVAMVAGILAVFVLDPRARPLGAVVVGAVAAAAWQPCVGLELGEIVTDAPNHRAATLLPTASYLVGLSLVPAMIAVLPFAVLRLHGVFSSMLVRRLGAVLGAVMGAAMIAGVWDDLAGSLLAWSSL